MGQGLWSFFGLDFISVVVSLEQGQVEIISVVCRSVRRAFVGLELISVVVSLRQEQVELISVVSWDRDRSVRGAL